MPEDSYSFFFFEAISSWRMHRVIESTRKSSPFNNKQHKTPVLTSSFRKRLLINNRLVFRFFFTPPGPRLCCGESHSENAFGGDFLLLFNHEVPRERNFVSRFSRVMGLPPMSNPFNCRPVFFNMRRIKKKKKKEFLFLQQSVFGLSLFFLLLFRIGCALFNGRTFHFRDQDDFSYRSI